MASEFAEDLKELRQLLQEAKRPRVLALLSNEIAVVEKQFSAEEEVKPKSVSEVEHFDEVVPVEVKPNSVPVEKHLDELVPTEIKPAPRQIHYISLSTFSWDEESDKVKIYISLEGATQEKVSVDFQSESVSLKIHDVNDKNYQFSIPRLSKTIVPAESKFLVKPKRIILTLKKSDRGSWYDLSKKEDKLPSPSMGKDVDPMAGLMGLMKNMYDDGDDEMKKTIAKAWTDARTGKAGMNTTPGMDI